MPWGTPPRKARADTWPSRKASVVSGRIGFDEAAVAVGQVDDETVGLLLHAADDHQGLAEVALGVARRMGTAARTSPWSDGDSLLHSP